jgi:hypothetical protein
MSGVTELFAQFEGLLVEYVRLCLTPFSKVYFNLSHTQSDVLNQQAFKLRKQFCNTTHCWFVSALILCYWVYYAPRGFTHFSTLIFVLRVIFCFVFCFEMGCYVLYS